MKRPRRAPVWVLALTVFFAGPACVFREEEEDPQLTETSAQVEAFDFYFQTTTIPLEPTVEATITLVNNGSALHSFSVPDLDVELEAEGGASGTVTFVTPDTPGAYEFFCKYHPEDMTGSLTIGAADADPVPDETETEIEVEDEDQDVDY